MRLSPKDFDALQNTIFELYEYRTLEQFQRDAPELLVKLFPCDYFFWSEYTIDPRAKKQKLSFFSESRPTIQPRLAGLMGELIMEHPFTQYFLQGGAQTTLKLSDFLTRSQLHRSEIYERVYGPWELEFNLSVPVNSRPGTAAGIGAGDKKRDFNERDRLMLDLLRKHFDQAHRNARRTSARLATDARPLADYGLTRRENEIAQWLGAGKSNLEIAMILGSSVRTIEKHMEKILDKLGVENRAAAAVLIVRAGTSC